MKVNLSVVISTIVLSAAGTVQAANTADDDAKVVNLEVTCAQGQNNCFDNLASLDAWLEGTRKPNAAAPVTVRVGNGTFLQPNNNALTCDGVEFTGSVNFVGEGAGNSVVQMGQTGNFAAFFVVDGCENMTFSNLLFRADAHYGYIIWQNGGTSRWDSVEVQGKGGAWTEANCAAEEGQHYWYSSKLSSQQAFTASSAYSVRCDASWLFGSEVTSVAQAGGDHIGNAAGYNNAVWAERFNNGSTNKPEVHFYGSNIRAISNDVVSNSPTFLRGTVYAGAGGEVHIHGTGVDSISTVGEEIYVLVAENGGFIHANESSYVIKTTGPVTRIDNVGSTIKAPYLWEQGDTPPAIVSANGADSFVDTSGAVPTMYIYADGCNAGGGPWVSAAGVCRQ